MSFSLIACVGKNLELGRENNLIFHIKDDMKFFRATTLNHAVLMGYKTFLSIGRPLKNRQNFVLSRHDRSFPPEIVQVRDLSRFISENSRTPEEIFVIGGATVYQQLLPFAKTLYLTEVSAEDKTADAFFPSFDPEKFEKTTLRSATDPDSNLKYSIAKYTRKEIS